MATFPHFTDEETEAQSSHNVSQGHAAGQGQLGWGPKAAALMCCCPLLPPAQSLNSSLLASLSMSMDPGSTITISCPDY